jgi:hypothetical protein
MKKIALFCIACIACIACNTTDAPDVGASSDPIEWNGFTVAEDQEQAAADYQDIFSGADLVSPDEYDRLMQRIPDPGTPNVSICLRCQKSGAQDCNACCTRTTVQGIKAQFCMSDEHQRPECADSESNGYDCLWWVLSF